MPPPTTDHTGPNHFAVMPDSNAPSSFDEPMKMALTADTRPRIASGVSTCTSVPRTTMLTTPIHDDDRVVLIASKGGDPRDPQWYRNLAANPDVQLTMKGRTRAMRARTASPTERTALWPDIVAVYKGYDSYQKRAGREIPVVICEPPPA